MPPDRAFTSNSFGTRWHDGGSSVTDVFVDFLAARHLPEKILCTLFFTMRDVFQLCGNHREGELL